MHPKLAWLEGLQTSLSTAMGTSIIFEVRDHVDPLKKVVVLTLGEELGKGDWAPIQKLIHGFAQANDCVVERITREPRKLLLHTLVKTRNGPVRKINPLR